MASVTLPRRAHNLNFIREHRNNQSCDTDDTKTNNRSKATRTLSYDQPEIQSSSSLSTTTSNTRFRDLCSRLKRRFSTKEHRTSSEDKNESVSERRSTRFSNYKSFSSSSDDPSNDFQWPDFEKVYDSIPFSLINALPGLDDFSIDKNDDYSLDLLTFQIDHSPTEQMDLFIKCKRGKSFRRNAICQKLDKTQYHGQLDIFIQQLMIEKLMRTWT
jgi:hypothetical protein